MKKRRKTAHILTHTHSYQRRRNLDSSRSFSSGAVWRRRERAHYASAYRGRRGEPHGQPHWLAGGMGVFHGHSPSTARRGEAAKPAKPASHLGIHSFLFPLQPLRQYHTDNQGQSVNRARLTERGNKKSRKKKKGKEKTRVTVSQDSLPDDYLTPLSLVDSGQSALGGARNMRSRHILAHASFGIIALLGAQFAHFQSVFKRHLGSVSENHPRISPAVYKKKSEITDVQAALLKLHSP